MFKKSILSLLVAVSVLGCASNGNNEVVVKPYSKLDHIKSIIEDLGYQGVAIREIDRDFYICKRSGKTLVSWVGIKQNQYEERQQCLQLQ